jgi:hypothetical protein
MAKKKDELLQELGKFTPAPAFPKVEEEKPKEQNVPPKVGPRVLRDEETGKLSGVQTGGKTFFAPPEDVQAVVKRAAPEATPLGAVELTEDIQKQQGEQQLSQLEQQQILENQRLEKLRNTEQQASTIERLQQSGALLFGDILGAFPFTPTDLGQNFRGGVETVQENPSSGFLGLTEKLALKATEVLGRIGNIQVFDFSLSQLSLGNVASSNIRNLTSDANKIVGESNKVLTMSLTRSDNRPPANLQQGIEMQKKLEAEARARYASAIQSLRESPKDVAEGLDLTDEMVASLNTIMMNRQMMERFQVTRDPTEIINAIGGISGIAAYDNVI